MDYTEQITYLLFLKMAWERGDDSGAIPARYTWGALRKIVDARSLLDRYHQGLRALSERPGLIGLIFTKPQSKISDPAKLRRLMDLIDAETWSSLDVDVKGEVYEGLLARNAEDVRGGAGQYFTPRPVVRAVVEVMKPEPLTRIADPACGTGGFLVAAFEYLNARVANAREVNFLRKRALRGIDLVPNVARLCAMNLYLHGIGSAIDADPLILIRDSLETPSEQVEMVLTNPPFGKKSSVTIVGAGGRNHPDRIQYDRPEFWATTSNKQLNFLQHVYSMLADEGRAAVVVPDNVLFESGAGEVIRRQLLKLCDVHTLLRLPTGIWYSTGVQANVLFFDKKPYTSAPATKALWVYDLRSGLKFSQRQNPLLPCHLDDFIVSYCADNRSRRKESARFRRFRLADIVSRDKANLDFQWRAEQLPAVAEDPAELMASILKDLEEAMHEFAAADIEINRSASLRTRRKPRST